VKDVFILEILDKIDGEETFAHAALAVENEIETFSHIVHRVSKVQLWQCAGRVFSSARCHLVQGRQSQLAWRQPTACLAAGQPEI